MTEFGREEVGEVELEAALVCRDDGTAEPLEPPLTTAPSAAVGAGGGVQ